MDETKLISTALTEVREFLDAQGWEYCLIGGLAASRWGEARFTKDIDLVVNSGIGDEGQFITPLLKTFAARYPDADTFARMNRIVLLSSREGVGIDLSLGGLEFEQSMLSRARRIEVLTGVEFRTATAEDILVMKSIAARPIDVKDIEGILATQSDNLDFGYIRHWLADLAELWSETDVIGVFEQAVRSVNERMKRLPPSSE